MEVFPVHGGVLLPASWLIADHETLTIKKLRLFCWQVADGISMFMFTLFTPPTAQGNCLKEKGKLLQQAYKDIPTLSFFSMDIVLKRS